MRLIDADALLRDIEHYHLSDGKFQHWVEIQPTIEPKRKTGRWIEMSDSDGGYWACSECGNELMRIWHYDAKFDLFPRLKSIDRTKHCPNCGADMRGDSDEKRMDV